MKEKKKKKTELNEFEMLLKPNVIGRRGWIFSSRGNETCDTSMAERPNICFKWERFDCSRVAALSDRVSIVDFVGSNQLCAIRALGDVCDRIKHCVGRTR